MPDAQIDTGLIGSVINALPLDRMFTAPIMAAIKAQTAATKNYIDFLMSVCIKDGQAVTVAFSYLEQKTDAEGNATGMTKRTMDVPLMAIISHPNICIDEGTIDFEISISQSAETKSQTEAKGGFSAKLGWGPFSVEVHGSVAHKSEQTRKTDTRAKYSVQMKFSRHGAPEGMQRIIESLLNSAKPVVMPEDVKELPADAGMSHRLPAPDAPAGSSKKKKKP